MTEEMIKQIDLNNLKSMELLKSLIHLLEEDDASVALDVLADCALEYLEKNYELLNSIL